MTNVTMKAVDTLHISEVGPHSILADEEFVVSKHTAADLEERGLATRIGDAPEPAAEPAPEPEIKADPPVENKMEPAPANKSSRRTKA